ncbi:MAG: spermidine/putrescine ABC transporter ATP-binding protein [Desulfotalea sp.]|nr:MAG: spermidine/putrescine ABC transporter ATP-binding protein [Desulfotalea sp.]
MNTFNTPGPILHVDSVSNQFGNKPLLQDINFSLEAGKILCLLGPSGSGKTTLLRLIAGLEEEYSGTILFKGKDIQSTPPHKRGFGLMFQEYALFPHKNVQENISFGLEMQKLSPKTQRFRVEKMLELVGLSGFGKRRIDALSGGERQRVALARSLAPEPQLLLLDEPLGSLDRTLRERLTIEIRAILNELGVTAIFVTHDQNEAFGVADKIAILKQGVLQQFATPQQLYQFPSNTDVALFLGFTNLLDVSIERGTDVLKSKFGYIRTLGSLKDLPPRPTLLLRPEGAKLASTETTGTTEEATLCIRGIVKSRRYQGGTYDLEIESHSQILHFDLPLHPQPPSEGSVIELCVAPSAQVLIAG